MHIDDLSNRVLDAIEARKYDEAEKLCQRLLAEYPEAFDGYERLAMLREAQGRFQEAADHYATVLEMMQKDPHGIDEETIEYVSELREEALARASG